MSVTSIPFGESPAGFRAHLYLLSNGSMTVGVTDLGACLVSCRVPDGRGNSPDVVLGFDNAARYADNLMTLGGLVGRVANRIADARFALDGKTYQLTANNEGNCLHGGRDMWFQRPWSVESAVGETDQAAASVTFVLRSVDGDQGFPGAVDVRVTYRLAKTNKLQVRYCAVPAARTLVNLTCHAYWNLNGHASGAVLGHELEVAASCYTPTDQRLIPTGELAGVAGTPLDLREPRKIGACFREAAGPFAGFDNYDHNFVLDGTAAGAAEPAVGSTAPSEHPAATLAGDASGIRMRVTTTAPGLQVYTASCLGEKHGKDGAHYGPYAGVALETQLFPDAIHHPEWPAATDPVFGPDRPFLSSTTFSFE